MSKFRFHSPVLFVKDLDKMKTFYLETLLQEIESDFGACIILKSGISLWSLAENHPIAERNGQTWAKEGNKNLELCFETEEFEPVLKRLKEKNLKLIHDVIEESWGQYTIRFTDPEGNIIELGESIACFVNRLYHEGMSIAEIVQKTSVNKEQVEEYLRI